MSGSQTEPPSTPDVLRALGDPVRWEIIRQLAGVGELACARLEETLPISKSTISHHVRILVEAGLVAVRKQGRNRFYALRRDALRGLVAELADLAPGQRATAAVSRTVAVTSAAADAELPTW
ncbi:ArsR/SmtB family transcription factor [Pseudonocardia hispaniensis]|uniref:ArsR/SmtB family transcription factor n=1 Tax=Pseudonocardia hispaniensis TaxID=904933 RepID=A0ABW1J521_9PSEU